MQEHAFLNDHMQVFHQSTCFCYFIKILYIQSHTLHACGISYRCCFNTVSERGFINDNRSLPNHLPNLCCNAGGKNTHTQSPILNSLMHVFLSYIVFCRSAAFFRCSQALEKHSRDASLTHSVYSQGHCGTTSSIAQSAYMISTGSLFLVLKSILFGVHFVDS